MHLSRSAHHTHPLSEHRTSGVLPSQTGSCDRSFGLSVSKCRTACERVLTTTCAILVGFVLGMPCVRGFAQVTGGVSPRLEGTDPLQMDGDIASQLISAVDTFLLRSCTPSGQGEVDTGSVT